MDTTGRITLEGLLLTRAMREYAQGAMRGQLIRVAIFFVVGLVGSLFFFAFLDLASEESRSKLGLGGIFLCLSPIVFCGMAAAGFGWPAFVARRLARSGTYARYVGPFTVLYSESSESLSAYLKFADKRLTLGDSTSLEKQSLDVLGMYNRGVVDWIPGLHVLTVWNDSGDCVFRTKGYEADPDVPPPPVRRTKRRAWPEE